ncbi:alpha/beta-hydrolase [Microthyrium microscopicum]|uniref:triacylglycerol lipase n=1 Tax=Microthyrium microscopicum TaxID=703497 RepID=A0A6A6U1G6_9PEZI|nr:alpha/beta-hydrolase [Microthyrium microscopicum]
MRRLFLLPLSLLALLGPATITAQDLPPILLPGDQQLLEPSLELPPKEFSLQYIFHHGSHKFPSLHRRFNVTDPSSILMLEGGHGPPVPVPKLAARSQTLRIERLADRSQGHIDHLLDAGRMRGSPLTLDASAWTIDEVPGPNVTDKETVLSMARMAANAYITDHNQYDWHDVGNGFNYTEDFGWENDGLRGHIFADSENQTVVIAIKGTSPAVFDGSGTTTNDKINDNLFFSCCCGQGGRYGWLQVCDCQTSAFQCNSTCVVDALKNKNRYYYAAQEIYRNVSMIYPHADIWIAGHSLGGSVSSLVALTYGLPVVTFEAPGEAMPAKRLGLPTPPGYHLGAHQQRASTGGFHFGHTADPIFMGSCNTYSSVCTIAGYAMQSICHTGQTCTYDTVGDLGWRVGAGTHKIESVLRDVIEKYDTPANCTPMVDCTDCFNWEFYESNHTETTTSKTKPSSTSTATRTSTCKTPGWWGCLDESTTTKVTTTTSVTTTTTTTETTTTTTCKTPGWFGCNDKTDKPSKPIQTTTRPTTAPATSTSSCHDPGWFGCKDPSLTATTVPKTPLVTPPPTNAVPAPTSTPAKPSTCIRRNWLGRCSEWSGVNHMEWEL